MEYKLELYREMAECSRVISAMQERKATDDCTHQGNNQIDVLSEEQQGDM